MPHRSYEGGRRYGRDDYRFDRDRPTSRYGVEGRSWDDAPSSGYREGGYSSEGRRAEGYGADFGSSEYRQRYGHGSENYGGGEDYGRYRNRNDAYGESGYRSGGYGERQRQDRFDQTRYSGSSRGGGSMSGWNTGFGGDYGQGGHGGFGSGGSDGVTQTGGSAGMTGGHSPYGYQQGGYAPGAQIWEGQGQNLSGGRSQDYTRDDYEPDYLHWRESQMRDLDRDYHEWRSERRQKFSREFDDWRNQRRAQSGQTGYQGHQAQGGFGESSTLSQAGGGYGTPGASSDGDQGGTLQSNPQVTKVSGADGDKKKN